ncbi:MAG: hypothetical protein AB7U61_04570 [Methylocystis sp.]
MGIIDFLKVKKGSPASQIGELEASLERLRAELKEVNSIVESHGQRRADALLSDVTDAEIANLDAAAALAQIRLERLELAELELVERIEAAKDATVRQRRAAQLEKDAAAIEERVKAINAAIDVLGGAFTKLVEVIPSDSGVLVDADHMTRPASPEDVARAVLASGLYVAAPTMFEMIQPRTRSARPASVERVLNVFVSRDGMLSRFNPGLVGEECTIPPTADAADQIIVSPLREQAARLRDSAPMSAAAE